MSFFDREQALGISQQKYCELDGDEASFLEWLSKPLSPNIVPIS